MAKKTTKKKVEAKLQTSNKYKDFPLETKEKIKQVSVLFNELRDIVFAHADIFYPDKPFSLAEVDFFEKYYKTYTGEDKVPQNLFRELQHSQNCRIDTRLKHIKNIITRFDGSYMDEENAIYLISSHIVVMINELKYK